MNAAAVAVLSVAALLTLGSALVAAYGFGVERGLRIAAAKRHPSTEAGTITLHPYNVSGEIAKGSIQPDPRTN